MLRSLIINECFLSARILIIKLFLKSLSKVVHRLIITQLNIFSDGKPVYQFLEEREGHVPVYIRFGDQSLAEINPSLAEAFGEHEVSARNIKAVSLEFLLN